MKIILVTSDLTYAPENYKDVFEFVVRNSRQHIAGVVLVRINKFGVLAKLPYLYFAGCQNIANTLARNFSDALFGQKKIFLKNLEIPSISVKSINDQKAILWLQTLKPDLILNMRARCIYKDAVLKIPHLGCANVHHGILPHQKGLFCDLYALADNRAAGFTIHQMTNYIDQGQILYREEVNKNKNYIDYLAEVALKEKVAIVNFIERIVRGNILSGVISNSDQRPAVTTTPNFRKIKELQHKGIIL